MAIVRTKKPPQKSGSLADSTLSKGCPSLFKMYGFDSIPIQALLG